MKGNGKINILGIVLMVLGVLAIAAPVAAGTSVILLIGVLLLIGGIVRLVWAAKSSGGSERNLWFVIGGLMTICGIVMLAKPGIASGFLTIVLAIYFVADGLFEMIGSFRIRPAGGWTWMLFGGIVSLLLGILIWRQYPISGALAIGVFLGIKLILSGLMTLMVGATGRSMLKDA
jgi:uncharacterized membrane protein HdeD (DUF308 family)